MISAAELIKDNEKRYESEVKAAADRISACKNVKLVLVSGPSCSGKTTTTSKLKSFLEKDGKKTHMLSIDDFFKSPCDMDYDEYGNRDYESIDSIDLDELHKVLSKLVSGKKTRSPVFDFVRAERCKEFNVFKLGKDDIAIIEGLHALNPKILNGVIPPENIFRLFLDCHTEQKSEMRYSRLMRRLVRDYNYRNTNAESTFARWKSVLGGEQKYVYPFVSYAECEINTYFEYEKYVFRDDLLKILSEVKENSEYYENAKSISDFLKNLDSISKDLVPKNSLLQEFL
ncbi:MAG: nucleoside kinase [Clostridia bacterium]|nr:nucleoside kinase [Clostridia bacterium]